MTRKVLKFYQKKHIHTDTYPSLNLRITLVASQQPCCVQKLQEEQCPRLIAIMYSGLQLLSLHMHKDSMAQYLKYFILEIIVKYTSSQRSTQAKVSAQLHCSPLPVVKVPESTHSQMKKKSCFLVLAKLSTIFYIYEVFDQLPRIWSLHDSRIFSQINRNLLKCPNFLKFFDRTEIYDILSAICDLPRGYSFFTLEIACKWRKLLRRGKFGRIVAASKVNFIWCSANPQLSNTPIWGFL